MLLYSLDGEILQVMVILLQHHLTWIRWQKKVWGLWTFIQAIQYAARQGGIWNYAHVLLLSFMHFSKGHHC